MTSGAGLKVAFGRILASCLMAMQSAVQVATEP